MSVEKQRGVLRKRDGHEASVTNAELFFDLLYAFAVTQLSHHLLGDLTLLGAAQTLVLWFAVWLAWQYTCWVTNWFDPDAMPIRIMLLAVMMVGLLMSAALPEAFGDLGLVFALCYALIQVGRTLTVLLYLGGSHALTANFRRILGWMSISAVFWIAGGLAHGSARLCLWAIAVMCEYVSPMIGFKLPGLGRSTSSDWTIEGGHLAERCQLFVMVALGESILVTGATVSDAEHWDAPILIAFLVAFLGSVSMWWMYFDTSSKAGSAAITRSDDPGRIGSHFHYVHVIIIAGIIASAVGSDLVLAHPDGHIETTVCGGADRRSGDLSAGQCDLQARRLRQIPAFASGGTGCAGGVDAVRMVDRSADGRRPDDFDHDDRGRLGSSFPAHAPAGASLPAGVVIRRGTTAGYMFG